MRIAALVFCLLALATAAYAEDSSHMFSNVPANAPEVRDNFYCQTVSGTWNAFNASVGFESEMADDIPSEYEGYEVGDVTMYFCEWAAGWRDPQSFIINFYNNACPPNMDPDYHFEIPWADCTKTLVYSGSWYVYEVTAILPTSVFVGPHMSIGGIVGNTWGQNAPYCGLCITDYVSGCGEVYWDGAYWGAPRWTPGSYYFGIYADLAYCLSGGFVPTQETTWGQIRSLFH